MGREIKRIALDFDWPMDMRWKGYMNPYSSQECKGCNGGGQNPETKALSDTVHEWDRQLLQEEVDALVASDHLRDFTHVFVRGEGWKPIEPKPEITAEFINKRPDTFFRDPSAYSLVKVRAMRLGVYGNCKYCDGEGRIFFSEEIKKLEEAFEKIDPPEGEGYQLWSTTTEGHPMSPVFDTPEKLATWLFENEASSFGSSTATYEEWMKFIQGPGWAPTAVVQNGVMTSGVQGLADDA